MAPKKSPRKVKSVKKNKSPKKRSGVKWGPFEKRKNKSYRPKGKCFLIEQNVVGKCVSDPTDRLSYKCWVPSTDKSKDCGHEFYQNKVYKLVSDFLVTSENRNTIFDDISKMSENKVIKSVNDKMPSLEHLNKSHQIRLQLQDSTKDSEKNIYKSIYDNYKGNGYQEINTFLRGTFGTTSQPFIKHISYKIDGEKTSNKFGDSSSPMILLFKYLFNLKKITESKKNSKKYNKIFLDKMKKSIEEMSEHFLEKTQDFNKVIKNIKLGIEKSPALDKDIVVFRGVSLNNDIFEDVSFKNDTHQKNILNIKKFNEAIKFSKKGKWTNIDAYGEKNKEKNYWNEPLTEIIPKIFIDSYSSSCKYSLDELNKLYNNFFSLTISKLNSDSTFTEKGFSSTSYNPNVARDFGGGSNGLIVGFNKKPKCLFRINVPKGTKCFTITENAYDEDYNKTSDFGHDYEYEIILPPAKYKVNEIFRAPSKHEAGRFYDNEWIIDIDLLEVL